MSDDESNTSNSSSISIPYPEDSDYEDNEAYDTEYEFEKEKREEMNAQEFKQKLKILQPNGTKYKNGWRHHNFVEEIILFLLKRDNQNLEFPSQMNRRKSSSSSSQFNDLR
jgi:hypothetical protein